MNQHTHTTFENGYSDDTTVLNFLLEHVKGLSPSSLVPEPIPYKEDEIV